MLGKKSSKISAKTRFLYSHEYRDQKMGEKSAKQFFQKKRIVPAKKFGKNIVSKSTKTRFLYLHENRDQKKGVEKTRETIFPETNE